MLSPAQGVRGVLTQTALCHGGGGPAGGWQVPPHAHRVHTLHQPWPVVMDRADIAPPVIGGGDDELLGPVLQEGGDRELTGLGGLELQQGGLLTAGHAVLWLSLAIGHTDRLAWAAP